MPSPTTAGDLIRQALGLTNAVGVDQTLTADETSDCLACLNDIYEDFSNQNLALWGTSNQTFSTVAGQAVYTIGAGGNWNTVRPIRINEPAICTYQGIDFPVAKWDQETYNLVGLKTQQQPIVQNFLYVNDFPLGYVTLWPVPSGVVSMVFTIDNVLTNIPTAATALTFPPGYAKLYKYRLGIELAPLFGKVASEDVKKIYVDTMADIKRVNKKTPVARFDGALVDSGPVIWQRGY
jgi:hypothetical protein